MIGNILIGAAVLVAIILAVALFLPRKYSLVSSIVIERDPHDVFEYIRFLKNQENYSKWVMTDPNQKTSFSGTDGKEGFVYAWDSALKSSGKGEQEIVKVTQDESVDVEIRFEKPFKNIAQTKMSTQKLADGKTKVSWLMYGENAYPMNLTNIFIGKMLSDDLHTSLTNLKVLLERQK